MIILLALCFTFSTSTGASASDYDKDITQIVNKWTKSSNAWTSMEKKDIEKEYITDQSDWFSFGHRKEKSNGPKYYFRLITGIK